MVLSKILEAIGEFIISNLLGQLFNSASTLDWWQTEACFVVMLGLGVFFATLGIARVIGTKNWMSIPLHPLFKRRNTIEALILSAVVLGLYGTMRQFDSNREAILENVVLWSIPLYGIWIYASAKRFRSESSAG